MKPLLVGLVIVTMLLIAGALFPTGPLQEAGTLGVPSDVSLVHTHTYLLFAPLFRILDTLTLLALSQHIALAATAIVVFIAWRLIRQRRPRERLHRAAVEIGAAGACLAALLTVYAMAAFLPRPAPHPTLSDTELLRVDFHSHTNHSRDAAERYTVDWNREWHRRTGFDVAFITDHSSWAGIAEAKASNPARARDDVVLLSGAEAWFKGDHAIALGDSVRYFKTLDPRRIRFEPDSIRRQRSERPPTLLTALPLRHLDRVIGYSKEVPDGVVGIEVNDGSPKGLEQSRRDRDRVLDISKRFDLALVSGSNTHGPAQIAAAWTVMRIPRWRDMTPDELRDEIEGLLHSERQDATRVIERSMPYSPTVAGTAMSGLTIPWHVSRSMGAAERLVWLVYLGALSLILHVRQRTRP